MELHDRLALALENKVPVGSMNAIKGARKGVNKKEKVKPAAVLETFALGAYSSGLPPLV